MLKKFYLFTSLMSIVVLQACKSPVAPEDTNSKGSVQFSFNSNSTSLKTNKSLNKTNTSFAILLSANNSKGEELFKLKKIDLISFGDVFITQPVDLTIGDYSVTEFVVVNADNEAVYATPVEGSSLANVVNNPLPVGFSIQKDQVTNLTLEVVEVGTFNPEDFGYVSFKFDIVPVINFLATVSVYNSDIAGFILTDASLKVENGNEILFDQSIDAVTNAIAVKDFGSANTYKLTVKKSGYKTQTKEFSYEEIQTFKEKPVLFVLEVGQDETESTLSDGLVAYYPFNGNANDESGYGNNGVNHGATLTSDRKGNSNSAYIFDGSTNYISATDVPILKITNAISMSVWFKTSGTVAESGIINKANPNEPRTGYMIGVHQDNTLRADVIYDHSTGQDGAIFSTQTITDNKWHHAIVVYEGTKFTLYIDGTFNSQITYTDGIQPNNEPLLIGWDQSNWLSDRHFNGKIDDVRIYNRALTQEEITQLYTE